MKWLRGLMILAVISGSIGVAGKEESVPGQLAVISSAPIQIAKDTQKQVFYEDLDGNGKKEKIVLIAAYTMDEGVYHLTFKINDREMKLDSSWMGNDVNAFITDIDQQDAVKEIAIGGDSCSSDYETSFYRYQKGKVTCIGTTEGTIKPVQLDRTYQMVIPGDGTVHTYTRGCVLQTWYRDETYQLTRTGKLVMVPQDYYMMGTVVTLQVDLPVYEVPTLQGQPTRLLKAGQKAILRLTDDKAWCQIQDDQGYNGWFYLEDDMGVETTEGVKWSSEVFEGLLFAD